MDFLGILNDSDDSTDFKKLVKVSAHIDKDQR